MSTSPQSWRPLRAFDDGQKVYIEFPTGISQGEMPPLFVIGPAGGSELVNYRVSRNYYIVDRLFGAAELRLGDKDNERRVRIVRTDGRPRVMTTGGDDEPKAATAPGAPPDLRLQGERPRVTRLSRKVLGLGAVSALTVACALGYALQTRNKAGTGQELLSAGLPKDYTGPAAQCTAARTGAARRSRSADPPRRRCTEHRGSGNDPGPGGAALCRPDHPAMSRCQSIGCTH